MKWPEHCIGCNFSDNCLSQNRRAKAIGLYFEFSQGFYFYFLWHSFSDRIDYGEGGRFPVN